MNPITVAGVASALLAGTAAFVLVRPVLAGRMAWPALAAWLASAVLVIGIGSLLGVASPAFLIGVAAFALPILVLLEAAAVAAGADGFARLLVMVGWGVVVFPVTALVPIAMIRGCLAPDCGFEDFGAALPLVVSSSAYVLLARVPAGVRERAQLDRPSNRRAVVAGAVLWVAAAVWLAHLEGAVDEYVPRILLAAAVVPAAGALGWLGVDILRDTRRSTGRSLMLGWVMGMAAALPGAVSVGLPWSPVVGLLAGGLASLVFSLPGVARGGYASRFAVALLVASAVGFVGPPVSGDTVGMIFAARASVLVAPLSAFAGVLVFAVVVSIPIWLVVRRHASRERIPAELLADA